MRQNCLFTLNPFDTSNKQALEKIMQVNLAQLYPLLLLQVNDKDKTER